ncbi:MAG: voltage-gated potassium channel [Cellvibrionaceae bacterium]|jgi:voltage-gated potassium channel
MNRESSIREGAYLLVGALVSVFLIGVIGYVYLEGWTVVDALYMTAITLTTVGFGEVAPLSANGRIFTIFLMVIGIGTVAYGFSILGQYVLTMSLNQFALEKRMKREIESLSDHYVVCGYGRVGQNAAEELRREGRKIIVIDNDSERLARLKETDPSLIFLEGDATLDETLLDAGLKRAAGLLVCTGNDSDNLFVVLSARALSEELVIVVRSSLEQSETKMLRAGASRVISPYQIGGKQMAKIVLRPELVDMLDVVTTSEGIDLFMQDLALPAHSPLVGKSLRDSEIRHKTGVTVVLLGRKGERPVTSPGADTILQAGDHLIVVGEGKQVAVLKALAEGG